jgi:iron complex outermembrane receptor protein
MFGGNESFGGEVNTIVPEVAKDLEIGVEYGSKTVYLSLNGYHMWFNNELVLNGEYGLNGLPCHENVSKSYRRGVEVEFDWNFVGDFNVRLASGVSQNKINTESLGVKNHILSPAVTFDGDLFYDNDVIKVGVNTNYRSKMYIDTVNENSIPYLLTVNLYADYKVGQSEFGIRLNNVTDRVNYTNAAIGANGQVLYFRNAPMNFNVFVKYSF